LFIFKKEKEKMDEQDKRFKSQGKRRRRIMIRKGIRDDSTVLSDKENDQMTLESLFLLTFFQLLTPIRSVVTNDSQ